MDLQEFAQEFWLKTMRDECGEVIIPGKHGQIYEHREGKVGCMVLAKSSRVWNPARRKLSAVGCQIIHDGDTEGSAVLDPQDASQVRLAIRTVGGKRKRQLSEAQRVALVGRLRKSLHDAVTPDMRFISS